MVADSLLLVVIKRFIKQPILTVIIIFIINLISPEIRAATGNTLIYSIELATLVIIIAIQILRIIKYIIINPSIHQGIIILIEIIRYSAIKIYILYQYIYTGYQYIYTFSSNNIKYILLVLIFIEIIVILYSL